MSSCGLAYSRMIHFWTGCGWVWALTVWGDGSIAVGRVAICVVFSFFWSFWSMVFVDVLLLSRSVIYASWFCERSCISREDRGMP